MKLTSALALLPALVLANPLAVRQEERAKFTGGFSTDGNGCPANSDGVSVTISGSGQFFNETATVSLRDYRVNQSDQNRQCRVLLSVRFPLGCQSVVFANTLTGPVQLDAGATAAYQRVYVLPTAQLTGNRPADLRFTSANGPDFIQEDRVSARVTINNAGQAVLPFSLEGSLSLQRGPNNNANGQLANDVWSVSITEQGRCCELLLCLPAPRLLT